MKNRKGKKKMELTKSEKEKIMAALNYKINAMVHMVDKVGTNKKLEIHDEIQDMEKIIKKMKEEKFGCHFDTDPDMGPWPTCWIDDHDYNNCIHAEKGMCKEDCEHWKEIN